MKTHSNPRHIGREYEKQALSYLQDHGLELVEANFSCRLGEIDLIMLDQETLTFIEVRFRKNSQFGSALESITRSKQNRIIKTAGFFLNNRPKYQQYFCRFDAFAIELDSHQQAQYHWLKSAFTE